MKEAYEEEKVDEYDEENLPPASTARLMKLNSSEWPQLLFGSLAAAVNGSVLPICAAIISFILEYLGYVEQSSRKVYNKMRQTVCENIMVPEGQF